MPSPQQSLILIVEDYLQNLQVLGKNLENAGYNIAAAKSGEDALKVLEKITPDLILLDVMMPGIDGYEVCEILKSDRRHKDIPIIFLTAKSDPESILEGFQKGAADYIYKPFNTAELLARVKTHLTLKRVTKELEFANNKNGTLSTALDELIALSNNLLRNPVQDAEDLETLSKYIRKAQQVLEDPNTKLLPQPSLAVHSFQ